MSRAINVSLNEAEVKKLCDAKGIAISAMEPLPSGGTRVICVLMEGTDAVRAAVGKKVLDDKVRRYRFFDPRGRGLAS